MQKIMSACCLLHKFRELNKTTKLKGANIDDIPTLVGIVLCYLKIVWFEFAKIRGAKINLHMKSSAFKAAKLKGFTVSAFSSS